MYQYRQDGIIAHCIQLLPTKASLFRNDQAIRGFYQTSKFPVPVRIPSPTIILETYRMFFVMELDLDEQKTILVKIAY